MESARLPEVDRRDEYSENTEWWNKLSLAQKFSASSLGKFGYELVCIRNIDSKNIAILKCGQQISIVSEDGEINSGDGITLRG